MSRESELERRVEQLESVVTLLGYYVKESFTDTGRAKSGPNAEFFIASLCATLQQKGGVDLSDPDCFKKEVAKSIGADFDAIRPFFQNKNNQ